MRGAILAALLASPAPLLAQSVTPPPVVATMSAANPAPEPIVTGERHRHAPGDPAEGVNRAFFSVHQVLDRIFFRPVALAYKAVIPKIVRRGIRHVISNLTEPVVFVNDVLQLKPKRAVRTFTRFAVNTTMGVGGVFDVAKAGDLPHRPNGLGNTLGRYGVGPGPYLFLPLVGPTDLRDLLGGQADGLVLPLAVGYPFDSREYIIARGVVGGLDARAEADADLKILLGSAADPYATLRSVYLQNRAVEVRAIRYGDAVTPFDTTPADPQAPATAAPAADAFDSTPADPEATPGEAASPAPATPQADTAAPPEPDVFDSTPVDPEPATVESR